MSRNKEEEPEKRYFLVNRLRVDETTPVDLKEIAGRAKEFMKDKYNGLKVTFPSGNDPIYIPCIELYEPILQDDGEVPNGISIKDILLCISKAHNENRYMPKRGFWSNPDYDYSDYSEDASIPAQGNEEQVPSPEPDIIEPSSGESQSPPGISPDVLAEIEKQREEIEKQKEEFEKQQAELAALQAEISKIREESEENSAAVSTYIGFSDAFLLEDYEEITERFTGAKDEFALWKGYILHINKSMRDLPFEYREILEKKQYQIHQNQSHTLLFPLSKKDIDASRADLSMLGEALTKLEGSDILDEDVPLMPGVRIRAKADEDYFLIDKELDSDVRLFLKKSLDTLFLIYKILQRKTKDQLLALLGWTLENDETMQKSITDYRDKKSHEVLTWFKARLEGKQAEKPLDDLLSKGELGDMVRDNYQLSTTAREVADKLQKKYIQFLQKTFFLIYNELRRDHLRFKQEATKFGDNPLLSDWVKMYQELIQLFEQHLKQIDIGVITDEVRTKYDSERHNPFSAEADNEYENDMIKEICNAGFVYQPDASPDAHFIMKQIDVIVVNNN